MWVRPCLAEAAPGVGEPVPDGSGPGLWVRPYLAEAAPVFGWSLGKAIPGGRGPGVLARPYLTEAGAGVWARPYLAEAARGVGKAVALAAGRAEVVLRGEGGAELVEDDLARELLVLVLSTTNLMVAPDIGTK